MITCNTCRHSRTWLANHTSSIGDICAKHTIVGTHVVTGLPQVKVLVQGSNKNAGGDCPDWEATVVYHRFSYLEGRLAAMRTWTRAWLKALWNWEVK